MASTKNGEFDNENNLPQPTASSILKRLVTRIRSIAVDLDTTIPFLEQVKKGDRQHRVDRLANKADEIGDAAAQLGTILRASSKNLSSRKRHEIRRRILNIVGPLPFDQDLDSEVTKAETPTAILRRLVTHLYGVAISLSTVVPLLEAVEEVDREYLVGALADEADELRDAAADLGPALRTLYR